MDRDEMERQAALVRSLDLGDAVREGAKRTADYIDQQLIEKLRRDERGPGIIAIERDRYGGTYSGARWIAWGDIESPDESQSDDTSCYDFWHGDPRAELAGKGDTPQLALADLLAKRGVR